LALLDNGVDPYHLGKGDWIWQMNLAESDIGVTTVQGVIDYEKAKGIQFLIVKCCDGGITGFNNNQFNTDLVTRCHNAGIKIIGFGYVYGSYYGPNQVQSEIDAAVSSMRIADSSGVPMDGFLIDAEIEYNGQSTNAITYCQGIRAQFPHRFLAHSPYPIPSYNVSFPYIEFGEYCDAVFPQDYWYDQFSSSGGVTPETMLSDMNNDFIYWQGVWNNNGHASSVKPLYPIGQGFQGQSPTAIPGSELTRFYNAVKSASPCATAGGYQGISFWSCQHHTADMWNAIAPMTFDTPPVITNQPVSLVKNQGSSASFNVVAGPSSVAYQWRKGAANLNNGGNVSGTTTATLTLTNVTTNDAANYSVVLTNSAGSLTSSVATLTVYVPPTITAQPLTNATIVQGNCTNLSVTATGTAPLSYYWQRNGNTFGVGTNTFQVCQAANYSVLVSNVAGVVTSTVTTVTVLLPPSITSEPQSVTNLVGNCTTFMVTAGGTPPLSYYWQFNGVNRGLGTNTLHACQAGNYAVVVSNATGQVAVSDTVTLTFTNAPAGPGVFSGIGLTGAGAVALSMSGTAGSNYTLEFTSNWVDWVGLTNLSSPSGMFQYTDTPPADAIQRFYRLQNGP
jgi:hypothetical protein